MNTKTIDSKQMQEFVNCILPKVPAIKIVNTIRYAMWKKKMISDEEWECWQEAVYDLNGWNREDVELCAYFTDFSHHHTSRFLANMVVKQTVDDLRKDGFDDDTITRIQDDLYSSVLYKVKHDWK